MKRTCLTKWSVNTPVLFLLRLVVISVPINLPNCVVTLVQKCRPILVMPSVLYTVIRVCVPLDLLMDLLGLFLVSILRSPLRTCPRAPDNLLCSLTACKPFVSDIITITEGIPVGVKKSILIGLLLKSLLLL